MKILSINSVPYGSTGNIMLGILKLAEKELNADVAGYYAAWRETNSTEEIAKKFGYNFENRFSFYVSYFTGFHNMGSILGTLKLIKDIENYSPDILHLHNLHLWMVNLPMLFSYIKKNKIKVVWTLHDCWAFTGQCPHFTMVKCEKWKNGCHDCPQYRQYPASYVDRTKTMWKLKKKWFTGVENLTIVTPSKWLAGLVKESYLKEYPVKVIYNGIDLSIFKPTEINFREKYCIAPDKKILLGVAFDWNKRKGVDVFIELAKRLPKEEYQIVLVGTNDTVDKQLPKNIISIHRTQNQKEMAGIYTAADLFVNPTREEVLGLVNVEALACETPVVTFKSGGSPECIDDRSGSVIDCDDVDAMEHEIIRICTENPYPKEVCVERSKAFDKNNRFKEYTNLYEEIVRKK